MPESYPNAGSRVQAVDALRGLVMIVMALDHTRDFFHRGAMAGVSATDLTRTSAALFLTRWITHFCLPVFLFTAGTGAYFSGRRRGGAALSRFLAARGLWLVFLELTVMQFAYDFRFSRADVLLLLVLWIFGICMLAMAGLVRLPSIWIAGLSVAGIALADLPDGVTARQFGDWAWLWNIVHQPGVFTVAGRPVLVSYPMLPWLAVMGAGYCFGRVWTLKPERRRAILMRTGSVAIAGFFLLRAINRYGDPAPWAVQKSAVFTVLSFLNCTKYPGSLEFLLMTLGPALVLTASFDRMVFSDRNPLIVFGRVPLFYFVLHFYLIHLAAVGAAWIRYGQAAWAFMLGPLPSMGGAAALFPHDFGYGLGVVYLVWIGVVTLLYPLCARMAWLKAVRPRWWLSYL